MWLDSKAVNCPQKWGNFKQRFLVGIDIGLKSGISAGQIFWRAFPSFMKAR